MQFHVSSSFKLFENYFVYSFKQKGLNRIAIGNYQSKKFLNIKFTEPTYEASLGNNPNFKTSTVQYNFSSLRTPLTVLEYNFQNKQSKILKREEIPSGHNPDDYIVERIWANSNDNTKVPLSLIRKKTTKINGTAPLLINGYGAYGISNDAGFRKQAFSLIDRGFIYVITHPRGGQELGRQWYENGKLLHKKNTFLDFIACTKTLIRKKYSSPDKIFARGGSAGGILMGYLANNAPALYRGIIAHVPFVDVINTMFDETLPLTAYEYNEWGNPQEKKYFDYIKSYSPYDNVKAQNYPNLLITAGLNDPRVTYWEPAKWTAKLRANKTDQNLLLLQINMEAGHGGKSGRFEYLKEIALEYAFIFKILGIKQI